MITIAFTRVPLVFNRVSCHVTSSKWHLCPLCLVQSFTVVNSSGCLKSRRLIIISIHLVVALFSRSNYDEAALLCCCTFKNACSRLLNFPRAMVATSRCGIRYLRDWHCSPHFVWLDRAVMYFFFFLFFLRKARVVLGQHVSLLLGYVPVLVASVTVCELCVHSCMCKASNTCQLHFLFCTSSIPGKFYKFIVKNMRFF